jgi:hypothetical protein
MKLFRRITILSGLALVLAFSGNASRSVFVNCGACCTTKSCEQKCLADCSRDPSTCGGYQCCRKYCSIIN